MVSSQLHELIRPVLIYVCDCYLYRQHGVEVSLNEVDGKLKSLFADIRRKVDGDEFLKREYAQVEKPLVFFVDYFFKENGFSFSKEYAPLARVYNELSGDDKFFDILDKVLATSQSSSDVIKSFYLMLGLGFDGAYKRDPKEVIPYINGCVERMSQDLNPEEEFITPDVQPEDRLDSRTGNNSRSFNQSIKEKTSREIAAFLLKKNLIFILIAITVLCFVINMASVYKNTNAYNSIVEDTVESASPYKSMSTTVEDDSTNTTSSTTNIQNTNAQNKSSTNLSNGGTVIVGNGNSQYTDEQN